VGHAVVPWQVKRTGEKGEIYVYDSNDPGGEDRKILIDLENNTWEYKFSGFWIFSDKWDGDGNSGSLIGYPYSQFKSTPTLVAKPYVIYNILGSAHLYFTDADGRHLGFVDGEFKNEIPDAAPLPSFIQGRSESEEIESYYLPLDGEHTTTVSGTQEEGRYTFKKYTLKSLLRIDASVDENSIDQITFDSITYIATYLTRDQDKDYSATLVVELPSGFAERSFSIQHAEISAGAPVTLQATSDLLSLKYNNRGEASEYNIKLEQIGLDSGSFTYPRLIIGTNETHIFTPKDWKQLNSGVILQIDKENDSIIDDTLILGKTLPSAFALLQNYPNPFSVGTSIDYQLPTDCNVELKIYDITGHLIKVLISDGKIAGHHTVHWNGKNDLGEKIVDGVYFYHIKAGEFSQTKKMVFTRQKYH